MAPDGSYMFRILLELELVGEGELEGEVLAVEIDLALVEDLGETEGVAGIDHEVTIFVRQADGEGEVETFHCVVHILLDIIELDLRSNLESWLQTCTEGEALDYVEVGGEGHIDVIQLVGDICLVLLGTLLAIEDACTEAEAVGEEVFHFGTDDEAYACLGVAGVVEVGTNHTYTALKSDITCLVLCEC